MHDSLLLGFVGHDTSPNKNIFYLLLVPYCKMIIEMKVVQNLKKKLSESIGIISVNKFAVLKKINLPF